MSAFDDFVSEAEAFFQAIFTGIEQAFGFGSPLSTALSDFAAKLKADIEAVKVVINGVEETLVPTQHVWDQVIAFVSNVKSGILGGAMASSWEAEAMLVLKAGIPIALSALGGAGPMVILAEETAAKLLAIL